MRGAVAGDAARQGGFDDEVANGLSAVGAVDRVGGHSAADDRHARGDREFWVPQDSGMSPPLRVESDVSVSVPGERLALLRAEPSLGLVDVLFGEETGTVR